MSSALSDVVVIGAGAVGVSVAVELAARGASVTLLERGPAPGSGCSSGNAGVVGPSHVLPLAVPEAVSQGLRMMMRRDSPFALRPRPRALPWLWRFVLAAGRSGNGLAARALRSMADESFALHREWARHYGVELFDRGFLTVYQSPAAFGRACEQLDGNGGAGHSEEVLDGPEAHGICPQLRRTPAGAVYAGDDAHCDPSQYLTALTRAAADLRIDTRLGVEVLGFRRQGGRVSRLRTTAGDIPVKNVVLAAGAWSPRITAGLPLTLPVQGGKGYHIDLPSSPGDVAMPVLFPEQRVVVSPMGSKLRLTGVLHLSGTDLSVDHRRVDAISQHAGRLLDGVLGRPVLEVWRGLRPCSPDGLPIIGAVPRMTNLVLATGHGMWGLQLAPFTARVVADHLASGRPDSVPGAVRPDRFWVAPYRR